MRPSGAKAILLLAAAGMQIGQAAAEGTYDPEPSAAERALDPLDRARALIRAEAFARAVEALEEARVERPDDPDVYNYLGLALRKMGDYETSEARYAHALALDPEHRGALEYMGELYLTLDRPEMARELESRLAAACPEGCEELDELRAAIAAYAAGGGG
jgi:Flp pilus assembly protein TadD